MKKLVVPILLLGFISACGSSYMIDSVVTNYPEGKELYKSKCAGCHQLYDRSKYSISEWQTIMIKMKKKSKINDEEKDSIMSFLTERDNLTNNN